MSLLPEFEYKRPENVNELFDMLSGHDGESVILAGGTDLMPRIKNGLERPALVIDIKHIEGLNYIKDDGEKVRIGALTTIYNIRNNMMIEEKHPALHEAAALTANEQIQLRGTLGGNVLQDTRCLYYNKPDTWRNSFKRCFKSGGDICNVVKGGKKCFSVYRGDLAPALMSLCASVCLVGKDGEKEILLENIFTGDGMSPFSLKKTDFIKEVIIPSQKMVGGYKKLRMRKSVDYSVVNVALSVDTESKGRLVAGSVGPRPFVYEFLSLDELRQIPDRACNEASPVNNMTLSPLYRKRMVRVLSDMLIRRVFVDNFSEYSL